MDKREFIRAVVVTVFCNSLVWYDYALYGGLISLIGYLFFPAGDGSANLIYAFGVFAVGFVMRPIGSLFFGHIGDKYGRRLALIISVVSMSIPAFLIGILPTYHSIGISSTIMLVLIRMSQGFSLGGEAGNAVFLIEHSPRNLRGFFGSFEVLSAVIGAILSMAIVALFRYSLTVEQLYSWGWRIPFFLGAFIGIIGAILRFYVAETPNYVNEAEIHSVPAFKLFERYKNKILIAIGVDSLEEASLYVFLIFIPSYIVNFGKQYAFYNLTSLLFLFLLAGLTLFFAYLSDIIGRRSILMFSAVISFVFSYPIFYLFLQDSAIAIIAAQIMLSVIIGASLGPISTTVVEMFPTNVAYTGLAFSRNISSAIFGGIAPSMCMFLIYITGNSNSAAFYLMLCSIILAISLFFLKRIDLVYDK